MKHSIPKMFMLLIAFATLFVSGCGILGNLGNSAAKPVVAAPVMSSGKLDSLWNSPLPADTLFLQASAYDMGSALLPTQPPLRHGPSSAGVIAPGAVWGWRVQLASSPERQVLADIVTRVEREFGSAAYLEDLGGRYALRIGAFDNLEQARREQQRAVSYGYKNAWIVQTRVPPIQLQREE